MSRDHIVSKVQQDRDYARVHALLEAQHAEAIDAAIPMVCTMQAFALPAPRHGGAPRDSDVYVITRFLAAAVCVHVEPPVPDLVDALVAVLCRLHASRDSFNVLAFDELAHVFGAMDAASVDWTRAYPIMACVFLAQSMVQPLLLPALLGAPPYRIARMQERARTMQHEASVGLVVTDEVELPPAAEVTTLLFPSPPRLVGAQRCAYIDAHGESCPRVGVYTSGSASVAFCEKHRCRRTVCAGQAPHKQRNGKTTCCQHIRHELARQCPVRDLVTGLQCPNIMAPHRRTWCETHRKRARRDNADAPPPPPSKRARGTTSDALRTRVRHYLEAHAPEDGQRLATDTQIPESGLAQWVNGSVREMRDAQALARIAQWLDEETQ